MWIMIESNHMNATLVRKKKRKENRATQGEDHVEREGRVITGETKER